MCQFSQQPTPTKNAEELGFVWAEVTALLVQLAQEVRIPCFRAASVLKESGAVGQNHRNSKLLNPRPTKLPQEFEAPLPNELRAPFLKLQRSHMVGGGSRRAVCTRITFGWKNVSNPSGH